MADIFKQERVAAVLFFLICFYNPCSRRLCLPRVRIVPGTAKIPWDQLIPRVFYMYLFKKLRLRYRPTGQRFPACTSDLRQDLGIFAHDAIEIVDLLLCKLLAHFLKNNRAFHGILLIKLLDDLASAFC